MADYNRINEDQTYDDFSWARHCAEAMARKNSQPAYIYVLPGGKFYSTQQGRPDKSQLRAVIEMVQGNLILDDKILMEKA